MNWDDYFLLLANGVSMKSKDPDRQVGAVIVGPSLNVLTTGYNGFARGVADTPERYQDDATKKSMICHAERNAIDQAARHGIKLEGATLYTTLFSCHECAKAVIQAGVVRVVAPLIPSWYFDKPHWSNSFDLSLSMLKEAGVTVEFIEKKYNLLLQTSD